MIKGGVSGHVGTLVGGVAKLQEALPPRIG